jgi:K+-transporting ATPase ATPase A chain
MLGEIIFGGVGAGMYGMLIFVVLTVFIAGLMVGRTPEYLGKKIEAYDVQMAMLYAADLSADHSGARGDFGAVAVRDCRASANHGPHGLTQILVCVHVGDGQQRLGVCGIECEHALVQLDAGIAMLAGAVLDDFRCWRSRATWRRRRARRRRGDVSGDDAAVHGAADGVIVIVGALTFLSRR